MTDEIEEVNSFPLMTPSEIRLIKPELNPAAEQGFKALRHLVRLARNNPIVKRPEFNAATHLLNELVRQHLDIPTQQTERLKRDLTITTNALIQYREGFWFLVKALNKAKKGAPTIGTEVMLRLPKDLLDRLPDHKARAESAQPDDAPTHSPTRPEVARQYGILNPEAAR